MKGLLFFSFLLVSIALCSCNTSPLPKEPKSVDEFYNKELDSIEKVIYNSSYVKDLPYYPTTLTKAVPKEKKDSVWFEIGYNGEAGMLSGLNFYYFRLTHELKYHDKIRDSLILVK